MFDWIKKLFGEGKIRLEFTDNTGKVYVGRVPYIGDIDTLDVEELRDQVSKQWFVEHGTRIVDFKILGYY